MAQERAQEVLTGAGCSEGSSHESAALTLTHTVSCPHGFTICLNPGGAGVSLLTFSSCSFLSLSLFDVFVFTLLF